MNTQDHTTRFLPDFDWSETMTRPPAPSPAETGWWVRSSAKQERSTTTGEPLGFRHSLMRGKRAVTSGIGADAARKFAAQAAFFNRIGASRLTAPCRQHGNGQVPEKVTGRSGAPHQPDRLESFTGKEVPTKIT